MQADFVAVGILYPAHAARGKIHDVADVDARGAQRRHRFIEVRDFEREALGLGAGHRVRDGERLPGDVEFDPPLPLLLDPRTSVVVPVAAFPVTLSCATQLATYVPFLGYV